MRNILLLFIFIFSFLAKAQNEQRDSLLQLLNKQSADTTVFKTLFALGDDYLNTDADSAIYYHRKAHTLALKLKDLQKQLQCLNELIWDYFAVSNYNKAEITFAEATAIFAELQVQSKPSIKAMRLWASCLTNIASVHKNKSDYAQALEHYKKALEINILTQNKRAQGATLANMASVYQSLGNYYKALEYNFSALKIFTTDGEDAAYAGAILGNIGLIYSDQGEFNKALDYILKSLKITEERNFTQATANNLENIGIQYMNLKHYQKAKEYFSRALKIHEQNNDLSGLGHCYGNLSRVYRTLGEQQKAQDRIENFKIALDYSQRAQKINTEIGNKQGLAFDLSNVGYLNVLLHQYGIAEQNLNKAYHLASSIGSFNDIKEAHYNLYFLFEKSKRHELALKHYILYTQYRDSVFNKDRIKESLQQEVKFNYEKKATADSVKSAELTKVSEAKLLASNAQLKQEKTQRYALYGGLILVAVFALFMVNRFRVINKQKKVIEMQKKATEIQKSLVEEKQKEILDSIRYAKRIQSALLTSEWYIDRSLKNLK